MLSIPLELNFTQCPLLDSHDGLTSLGCFVYMFLTSTFFPFVCVCVCFEKIGFMKIMKLIQKKEAKRGENWEGRESEKRKRKEKKNERPSEPKKKAQLPLYIYCMQL